MKENQKPKNLDSAVPKLFNSVRDVKKLGLMIFVGILLLITWSGVKVVGSNYDLQKQVSSLKQQIELDKLKNQNLQLKNSYYETNAYLEQSARQNLGLARPGEIEVVIPKEVALSELTEYQPNLKANDANDSPKHSNIDLWLDFLFHRN